MSIDNIFDDDFVDGLERLLSSFGIPTENDRPINKERSFQFDMFNTKLTSTVVNYYVNGASILEISQITELPMKMVDEILDRVIPYLD